MVAPLGTIVWRSQKRCVQHTSPRIIQIWSKHPDFPTGIWRISFWTVKLHRTLTNVPKSCPDPGSDRFRYARMHGAIAESWVSSGVPIRGYQFGHSHRGYQLGVPIRGVPIRGYQLEGVPIRGVTVRSVILAPSYINREIELLPRRKRSEPGTKTKRYQ